MEAHKKCVMKMKETNKQTNKEDENNVHAKLIDRSWKL